MTGDQFTFLQSLGWAVLNSLWQLALLWVIYQILTAVFKKINAASKSLLATYFLIAGFAWFIYTFFTTYNSQAASGHEGPLTAMLLTNNVSSFSAWLQKSLPIASLSYLFLLVFPVLRFIRNYRYVQVIRRYGLTKISANWRLFIQKTSAQMGIKKQVQIWVSEFVSSPVTIGFIKPVILVPLAAINHLTPQQLEAVLLHELSHIRRSDYLVNLIINFIQTILYFNPFAKAFVNIVVEQREKSCDDMVLQFQYNSHDYAAALLTLEKASSQEKIFVLGITGKKYDLLHRIESIMGVQKKPVISFNKLAGVLAGILCIIGLNSLLIITQQVYKKKPITQLTTPDPIVFVTNNFPSAENADDTMEMPAKSEADIPASETNNTPIINKTSEQEPIKDNNTDEYDISVFENPDVIAADFVNEDVPELKKHQTLEVKKALDASKKILESIQWKAIEKNIADVFSGKEKEKIKALYEAELSKIDWNKWEKQLQLAYNNINWDKINDQLSDAVNMVRIDSLQQVYSSAISKLDEVKVQLEQQQISSMQNKAAINLRDLEQKRRNLIQMNKELKTMRIKKVAHL
jgi:bla regulator protein blaR1